jgi:hypothetical protein
VTLPARRDDLTAEIDAMSRAALTPAPVERVCGCGCGASLDGRRTNVQYATHACRQTAYLARHPTPPPETAHRPSEASRNRHGHRPGGVTMAYGPILRAVTNELRRLNTSDPEATARRIVNSALTPAARARINPPAKEVER